KSNYIVVILRALARKNPAYSLKSWIASHSLAMTTQLQNYLIPRLWWDTSRTGEGTSRVSLRAVWLREGRKAAFTLAEVLITLGIIGVVAVMTIPNLMAQVSEKRDVIKLKKVYSSLLQASKLSQEDLGDIKTYLLSYEKDINWYDTGSHKYFGEYFMKYYNGVHLNRGYNSSWKQGWKSGASVYHVLSGNSFSVYNTLDGVAFIFRVLPNNCTSSFGAFEGGEKTCGEIFIDLHSSYHQTAWSTSNTNRVVGKNVFLFHSTEDGIVPGGTSTYGLSPLNCYETAYSCAAWVLKNGNMDYLHNPNLKW
ncbi:MAG: type II secretion system GspH family protein, partial [Muribaculaceae bacterium]|nr:type II secretion system GspH family protein [Muribaculaceae bacterium]